MNYNDSANNAEIKARTEMWNAITKLLEKAFELLVQEAERKRRLN